MPLIPLARRSRMLSRRVNVVLANSKFSLHLSTIRRFGLSPKWLVLARGYPLHFGVGARFRKAQRFRYTINDQRIAFRNRKTQTMFLLPFSQQSYIALTQQCLLLLCRFYVLLLKFSLQAILVYHLQVLEQLPA